MNPLAQKFKPGKWKNSRLTLIPKDNRYRFKVTNVINETVLAYYLEVEDLKLWLPKSSCTVGMSPDGNRYVVDVDEWLAKQKKLI